MQSLSLLVAASAHFALARCHAVIINAQGEASSPPSVGFQVVPDLARDCITINPCQQDATIIREAEIKANMVNECGRTELGGNIDIGESTEIAIAKNAVTKVKPGSEVTVTIHQVNADGAGPFVCDLEEDGNTGTKFKNLSVTNNVPGSNGFSGAKAQAFNMTIKMPDDLNCIGASTGNVCTVRCRNNALAGPFGGCFPVEQGDKNKTVTTPASIRTKQKGPDVLQQVADNQAGLEAANAAHEKSLKPEAQKARKAAEALYGNELAAKVFPQETPSVVLGGSRPAETKGNPGPGGSPKQGPGDGRTGPAPAPAPAPAPGGSNTGGTTGRPDTNPGAGGSPKQGPGAGGEGSPKNPSGGSGTENNNRGSGAGGPLPGAGGSPNNAGTGSGGQLPGAGGSPQNPSGGSGTENNGGTGTGGQLPGGAGSPQNPSGGSGTENTNGGASTGGTFPGAGGNSNGGTGTGGTLPGGSPNNGGTGSGGQLPGVGGSPNNAGTGSGGQLPGAGGSPNGGNTGGGAGRARGNEGDGTNQSNQPGSVNGGVGTGSRDRDARRLRVRRRIPVQDVGPGGFGRTEARRSPKP